jgi:tRNA threonylcarbamoyladenosine biosynthesis protein TsaB
LKILAVDSCSNVATCALCVDEKLVAEVVLNDKKTHSVKLLPQIECMLKMADVDITQIDYFAVSCGPGSFTGQRIGIATVKGLAHAQNKPCIGVSSLEALAYNVPLTPYQVCPIMDARRQQVYTATFKNLDRIKPDRAISLAKLLEEVDGQDTVFLGDGVDAFRDIIKETLGSYAHFPPLHLMHLRASSVAALASVHIKNGNTADVHSLEPLYLRLSQAERERLERSKGK